MPTVFHSELVGRLPSPEKKGFLDPWPRGDWVLDADVAARDAQRPGLTPGELKVLKKSRERALLTVPFEDKRTT